MVSTPAPPAPPNPVATAAAQSASNRETAVTQYGLGATNQVTPTGTLNYDQIGVWADGTPRFQATTALSPTGQANVDQTLALQNQYSNIAGNQLGQVSGALSQPYQIPSSAPTPSPMLNLGANPQAFNPNASTGLGPMPHQTDWNAVGEHQQIPGVTAPDPNSILPERQRIEAAMFERINPQMQQQRAAQETQLRNQGIDYGAEAWRAASDDLARQENDLRLGIVSQGGAEQQRLFDMMSRASGQEFEQGMSRRQLSASESAQRINEEMQMRNQQLMEERQYVDDQVRLRGITAQQAAQEFQQQMAMRQQLINESLTERQQPYSELSTLMTGSQPQRPAFQATPQPNVAGTNVAGLVMDAYRYGPLAQQQFQQQQNNALLGGLSSLGGSALGAFAMSDRRLKEDVEKVAETDDGLGIYKFRMKGSPLMQLGLMAQDVEKRDPKAVKKVGGFKAVNYERALEG
jgi:hypothetical protein